MNEKPKLIKNVLEKKAPKKIVPEGDINKKNSNVGKKEATILKNKERVEEIEKQKIIKKGLQKDLEKVAQRQAELALLVKNTWNKDIGMENDDLAKKAEVIGRQLDTIEIEFPEIQLEKDAIFQNKVKEIRDKKGDSNYIMTQKDVIRARKKADKEIAALDAEKDVEVETEKEIITPEDTEKEEVAPEEKIITPEDTEKVETEEEIVTPEDTEKEEVVKPDTEEKKEEVEKKEIPPVTPISPEKMKKLEQVLGEAEAKKALELESSKFKNGILKGINKWETFGQGEEGVKGFAKRMTKAAVNLALIGAISMVAVDQLAVAGIGSASALAGGVTSKLGVKMAMGLGIAGVLDASGKGMSEKTKKLLPLYLGIGGLGLAVGMTALSGGGILASGLVAGGASVVGYIASKLHKGWFTDEKIASKKESAIKELFQKYTNKSGEVYVNRLPELENELAIILKKFENRRIWGKLADGAMKLGIGSLISGLTMEAAGEIHDSIAKDHLPEPKNETWHEKQGPTNPETEHQETETYKPAEVAFSSRGGIQTILDMKAQIHNEYPDITKAPESVQEFMHSDATHEAIKLGLYDPNNPNGAESSMIDKGSILGFDQKGDLYLRDSHTGQSEFLMQSKDGAETITKFDGKMFDSDHSAIKIENTNNNQEIPNENSSPESVNPQGEPIENLTPLITPGPINHIPTIEPAHDTTPVTTESVTPITPEHTPVATVEPSHDTTPIVTPEAEKLIDFKFDNPNHIVPITENGGTLEMKFIYDTNHHIIGTDVSGNYHVDTNQYIDQVKLHELSGFDQGDASRDIFQMAKEAVFLDKLPHNTAEYQQVHHHVIEMQKSITNQYGDILNHAKIESDNSIPTHSTNETPATSHNTETVVGGFTPEQTLQIETVTHNNIEHIYPQEGNQYDLYWNDVKDLRADVLFHMDPVAEKFQPTLDYINKVHDTLGIEPKEPTIISSGEKIGEFFTRASEEAVKQGKVDQIEIK